LKAASRDQDPTTKKFLMPLLKKSIILALLSALTLACFSGCASTRSENGVTIEKSAPSLNPFDYIPYL
jgi:hypothetical protein